MMDPRRSSKLTGFIAEIFFRLRRGPRRTWNWILDRLRDSRSDREFGISSSARREVTRAKLQSTEFVAYQAVSYSDMQEILQLTPIRSSDVFLDFGSGMGRAICLAATYRFDAVIGVEILPELCEIARHNLSRLGGNLRSRDVQVIQGNAVGYPIPDAVSVFFFFNPFGGSALGKVLDNISRSVRKCPREIRVLFYGTVSSNHFRAQVSKHEWLKLSSETVLRTGAVALVYANEDSSPLHKWRDSRP